MRLNYRGEEERAQIYLPRSAHSLTRFLHQPSSPILKSIVSLIAKWTDHWEFDFRSKFH